MGIERNCFKVFFYLRSNYTNKEGKSAIMIQITLNRQRKNLGSTGLYTEKVKFENGQVLGSSKEDCALRKALSQIEDALWRAFLATEKKNQCTINSIKERFLAFQNTTSPGGVRIKGLFQMYIRMKEREVGTKVTLSTLRRYRVAMNKFLDFLSYKSRSRLSDIEIAKVTKSHIADFEVYLLDFCGYKVNYVRKTMQIIKTIFLYAISEELVFHNPFNGIKFATEAVDRGFLTEIELKKIIDCSLPSKRLETVRDLFVFGCFTGLSYIDMYNLTAKDITELNGRKWIIIRRQKTSVSSNVLLLDLPLRIIDKYASFSSDSEVTEEGRLLPMLSNQKMNVNLKEIARLAGIQKNLTFHLARHTFATMTLSRGVSIESVSKMLGHTSIRTTQIYARITNPLIEHDMLAFSQKSPLSSCSL